MRNPFKKTAVWLEFSFPGEDDKVYKFPYNLHRQRKQAAKLLFYMHPHAEICGEGFETYYTWRFWE